MARFFLLGSTQRKLFLLFEPKCVTILLSDLLPFFGVLVYWAAIFKKIKPIQLIKPGLTGVMNVMRLMRLTSSMGVLRLIGRMSLTG